LKSLHKLLSPRVAVIADYALYSSTNFVLGVTVARVANLATYGVYALLFQLGNFCLVMVRATVGEAWFVTQKNDPSSTTEDPTVPTAYAFAVGVALVPVLLLVAALLTDVAKHLGLVLAMAFILPALLAQDTHRFVCFASGNPWRAVFSNASWLTSQTCLLAFMALDILPFTAAWAALVWTIGAYVGLFTVGGARHLHPYMVMNGFRWWRDHRRVGKHLALETVGSSMVGPLVAIGLVMMGKEVALGVLRGASTLFSPILVLAQGMRTALTKRDEVHDPASMLRTRLLLTATSLVWGGLLFTAPGVGKIILGGLWGPSIHQIVLLEAAARMGLASAAIDSADLRRQSATLTAATIGFWSGGLVVALAVLGALVGDSFGAAVGTAAAYTVGALIWRHFCARACSPALQI
jgi:hypothetical protein